MNAQHAPDSVQRVQENDLELAVLGLELGDDRARSGDVPLTHRRGENEHAPASAVGLSIRAPRRARRASARTSQNTASLDGDEQESGD